MSWQEPNALTRLSVAIPFRGQDPSVPRFHLTSDPIAEDAYSHPRDAGRISTNRGDSAPGHRIFANDL